MSDLQLVVFDCDGTLVDSLHMILQTMEAAYADHGAVLPDSHHIQQNIGLSLEVLIADLSPTFSEAKCHALAASYREHFHKLRREGEMIEPLYDQARETVAALDAAGTVLGIATGKGLRGLTHVLDLHDMRGFFATLQTPDTAPGKPHPGMLENAMAETGARPEQTVMIGDTSFDMEMAANAGVRAIGVDWGYHDSDTLMQAGAHMLISDMHVLPEILKDMR